MRRKLVRTAAGFAVLFLASAWAAAQRGGRPVTPPPPPTGGGRPVGGGTGGAGGIGGGVGRPVGGGNTTRPIPGGTTATGKAVKAEVKNTFEAMRSRSPLDAAKFLRETRSSALTRPERAVLLSAVAHQFLRQQQISTEQQLAALRQFRADWVAVGPGVGLDPLVELELAAAESAAERLVLSRALRFIREKQYGLAAAEFAHLADSRHLPVAIVRAIPALRADLLKLSRLVGLNPDGELPRSDAADGLPGEVKGAIAGVEVIRGARELFAPPFGLLRNPGDTVHLDPEPRLAAVERVFGANEAGRVRVELSAVLFLVGRHEDARQLLGGEVDAEHAREVLADLRTAVVGGGQLVNAQVARLLPADIPANALAPLVPDNARKAWKAPTPPTDKTTTLAKLEKRAHKDVATAVAEALGDLIGKVDAAAEAIRTELAKHAGPLGPFEEKVKARLARPVEKVEEKELIAIAAVRGLAVDEVVALLAADADRPAQAARVVGAAFGPAAVAQVAVAARPPVSLKDGADGAFRLPADVLARDRAKVRDVVRVSLEGFAAEKAGVTRSGFEETVAKGCGLPGGQTHAAPEQVAALFDAVRDLAAEHARLVPEWRELNDALADLDERNYTDPKDREALRQAKERRDALARDSNARGRAVALGVGVLAEYGADASPALTWLSVAAGGSAPWKAAAADAVTRITAKPAPVPKPAKPPVECVLTLAPKKDPLDENAFAVELRNNTDQDIEVLSTLPGGLRVFLDVAIEGPDGKRISPEFYDRTIASPFAPPPRLVATLGAGKSEKVELWLARYVEKPDELKPGKYRVRVTFRYDNHAAVSEWVGFEIPKP